MWLAGNLELNPVPARFKGLWLLRFADHPLSCATCFDPTCLDCTCLDPIAPPVFGRAWPHREAAWFSDRHHHRTRVLDVVADVEGEALSAFQ